MKKMSLIDLSYYIVPVSVDLILMIFIDIVTLNKNATIFVAKIQGSTKLIGGYNPLKWDSDNSYKSTNDSFIFSFFKVQK